jgi:formate-dependent nitrite reductase membrane component NrfD
MKPYEWMVTYTPQTVWIERKGVLIWLSLYAGVLGGGTYLASLYFGSLHGMILGWLVILLIKSGLHLAHAKRPGRLWRMVLRPQTSWISRGLILTGLFIVFGALQIAASMRAPGSGAELFFMIAAGICAFGVIVYSGFTMSSVGGIPFWNSALLPTLFLLWAVLTGVVVVTAMGGARVETAALDILVLLVASMFLIVTYLSVAAYGEPVMKESAKAVMKGRMAPVFFIGVVLVGTVIPLVTSFCGYRAGMLPVSLSFVLVFCTIVGGLSLTYAALKAGLYSPLSPGGR